MGQFQTRYSFALELIRYRFALGCTTISMNYLSYSYITSNCSIDAGKQAACPCSTTAACRTSPLFIAFHMSPALRCIPPLNAMIAIFSCHWPPTVHVDTLDHSSPVRFDAPLLRPLQLPASLTFAAPMSHIVCPASCSPKQVEFSIG